jgi:hypothetical protein
LNPSAGHHRWLETEWRLDSPGIFKPPGTKFSPNEIGPALSKKPLGQKPQPALAPCSERGKIRRRSNGRMANN